MTKSTDDLWEFTFVVSMSHKSYVKLCEWESDREVDSKVNPEWLAGKELTKWFRRHGVKMKLKSWRMGRPRVNP
jgi:hypothetical protein